MSGVTWVDGEVGASVPIDDRGFRYGDGVFETMAVLNGRAVAFERHCDRLARGCDVLGLIMPTLAMLHDDLATMTLPDKAVLRLTVTRGSGGRGYAPPARPVSRRIWEMLDWPEFDPAIYRDGIDVAWLETRLAAQPALAGIKHLSRVEQILAARELENMEADDGLLRDADSQVIEAVSSNVFVRHGDTLATPMLDQCGVAGVTRERVLSVAGSLGYSTRVAPLRSIDLLHADEVFLTSSIRGIVPVRKLGSVTLDDFSAAHALQRHFHQMDGSPE